MTKSLKSIYKRADSFTELAKTKGYRSRSAIKLLELQKKDKVIKPNSKVLDLGSYPGGWSQVSKELVGNNGTVFSVDKKNMKPLKGIYFIHKELENLERDDFSVSEKNILPFDIVLSDIAPNISGITHRDNAEMIKLLEAVKSCINLFLKINGNALSKVFQGESFDNMLIYMKTMFQKVKIRKPSSSRSNSKETYIVGLGKKS